MHWPSITRQRFVAESFLQPHTSDAPSPRWQIGFALTNEGFNAAAGLIALSAPGSPLAGGWRGPAKRRGARRSIVPGTWERKNRVIGTPKLHFPSVHHLSRATAPVRNWHRHSGMQLIGFFKIYCSELCKQKPRSIIGGCFFCCFTH